MAKIPREEVARRHTRRCREMATDEHREAEARERVEAGNRLKLPLIECVHEARPGEEMTPERVSERLLEEEVGATEADRDRWRS